MAKSSISSLAVSSFQDVSHRSNSKDGKPCHPRSGGARANWGMQFKMGDHTRMFAWDIILLRQVKVIKLLAPNIDTGHIVGQGVELQFVQEDMNLCTRGEHAGAQKDRGKVTRCAYPMRSLGRNTEGCNFSPEAIHPQWRLLQKHLETKGPGWYPLAERKMNFVLMVILLRGVFGVLHRTSTVRVSW